MKGILFKPEMKKAIEEGRKTVTRRIIKPQPPGGLVVADLIIDGFPFWVLANEDGEQVEGKCPQPRYQVGEVVYVKEAWSIKNCGKAVSLSKEVWNNEWRVARLEYDIVGYWWNKRSPLFMPAWAARYFIKITAVRAERTKDITPEDCLKEGIERHTDNGNNIFWYEIAGDYHGKTQSVTPQEAYFKLYDSMNGNDAHEKNWDWVYSFERLNNAAK